MAKSYSGPMITIVGETASGKSSLALQLAQRFNGEIICADAWTVRKEANIGTAKPTAKEQALIRHHLLDIITPESIFNAADFKRLAKLAVDDIGSRKKLPILVGGTGLYVDSILYDYQFLDSTSNESRKELSTFSVNELVNLAGAKNISLVGIDINNKHRLIRLIETDGAKATKSTLRKKTLIIGLKASDNESLKKVVDNRVDEMILMGLEKEVKALSVKYGWDAEALKAVGYKEWQYVSKGPDNIENVKQEIIKNTVRLAKRQRTWFKRNKSIQWFLTPVIYDEVVDLVTTFIG